VPRNVASAFPVEGTSLERYAARFPVAEINSSFHRPHRLSTWERWRDNVPADFRFSVKLPKTITHQAKLQPPRGEVPLFLEQAHALGDKLAVVLVQLPPKLELDEAIARSFFTGLSASTDARIACEPRHLSWFTDDAGSLLSDLKVARVAADPAICEAASVPGGWPGLHYWRLHGSPVIYRSSYSDRIATYADRLRSTSGSTETWCIFDNTASSAAASDALALVAALHE
jgi:uncharacterized protein YecE (DUF72 family)